LPNNYKKIVLMEVYAVEKFGAPRRWAAPHRERRDPMPQRSLADVAPSFASWRGPAPKHLATPDVPHDMLASSASRAQWRASWRPSMRRAARAGSGPKALKQ